MKRIILPVILTLLLLPSTNAQQLKKVRKVVPLLTQQSSYLNGGMRATFGGKSRAVFEINLPFNTIEWYYTFTTVKNEAESKSLNLVPQLTRLFDPTGMTALAASAILSPTGSNSCDVFLLDPVNVDAFINKADLKGGNFSHYRVAARENFRNGVVSVSSIKSGKWYLGFRNPSSGEGIGIILEAAAIVEETEIDNNVWASETKQRLFNDFYQTFRLQNNNESIAKEIAECMVTKITELKSLSQYDEMPRYEKESLIKKTQGECSSLYKKPQSFDRDKAINYGTIAWNAYEVGDVDKCIEFSKKALLLDNSLGWIKANIGLCYLIKGDESTAGDYYVEALLDYKKESASLAQKYLKATIEDIDKATVKLGSLKGSPYIKSLLESELKKY